jgi:hypothetical protein
MSQVGATIVAEELVSPNDYVELSRLVIEHAWRADHDRSDTIHELYMEDGVLDLSPVPLRGCKTIQEWGRRLVEAPPWRVIRHVCGNMRFVADGPDAANGITVLTAFMTAGSGPAATVPFSVREDHDRFVRTKQGWRLASRRWVELFSRGDILVLP